MNYLKTFRAASNLVAIMGAIPASILLPSTAFAAEPERIWRVFKEECSHVLENPDAYADGELGIDAKVDSKLSPDGQTSAINKTIDDLYVEAFIYRFADRDVRHCAVYATNQSGVNLDAYSGELMNWLSSEHKLEVIGGYAPLYTEEYVIGILGSWPKLDLETRARIDQFETQFLVRRTVTKK